MVYFTKNLNLDPYLGIMIFKTKLTHGKPLCFYLFIHIFLLSNQELFLSPALEIRTGPSINCTASPFKGAGIKFLRVLQLGGTLRTRC